MTKILIHLRKPYFLSYHLTYCTHLQIMAEIYILSNLVSVEKKNKRKRIRNQKTMHSRPKKLKRSIMLFKALPLIRHLSGFVSVFVRLHFALISVKAPERPSLCLCRSESDIYLDSSARLSGFPLYTELISFKVQDRRRRLRGHCTWSNRV